MARLAIKTAVLYVLDGSILFDNAPIEKSNAISPSVRSRIVLFLYIVIHIVPNMLVIMIIKRNIWLGCGFSFIFNFCKTL